MTVSFGRLSFAIDVADSATPAQRYSAWAQALGVSETETLQSLDTDDGSFAVTLGASPYNAGSTIAMFASEGGFAPYKNAPANTVNVAYPLATVNRMYGFTTRPDALVTFHPDTDCRSLGVLFQRAGAVSIFKGRIRNLNTETYRLDFALRVNASGWELVVQPLDLVQPVKLFGNNSLVEVYSLDVAVGESKAFTFAPTDIVPAPLQTVTRSLVYVNSAGAMPAYGGTTSRSIRVGRKDHLTGVLGQGIGRVRGNTFDYSVPNNKPYSCRVRLIRETDGLQMRELWSGADGGYDFTYVDELQSYTVLAQYLNHGKRAVLADGLTLANGGVELMP
ncbi:hypothetical protein [Variovorax sp. PAMC26660]|uniref:hypothetical protein n=1 Tax=Variovorax sp. PAMC26660 TaxID=2762322 RepID=UPI00164EA176|nr:hypothetical protein [Variovorax sp. PAMC26660]QNK69187.1 hypothetical protein H7F35_05595 [Variovorax sp. PAMC26660]